MIEPESSELSLKMQAGLLGISRSSLYYFPLPPSPEEVAIKHRIDEIYTRWPFYGSRRITVVLNQEEIAVSRLTIQRFMREMGIVGIVPVPNTSKPASEHKIYPYLLRQVTASYPNHVWGMNWVTWSWMFRAISNQNRQPTGLSGLSSCRLQRLALNRAPTGRTSTSTSCTCLSINTV